MTHRRFLAELDLQEGRGSLYQVEADGAGLTIALRVALCALLPRWGGLPLHGAGVVVGDVGFAFVGRSGAGKSTLAATSPYPVLSDELVAVGGVPWHLAPSGFWGAHELPANAQMAPLAAVVELDKGPVARLDRLARQDALRSLLDVVLVPPAPQLWNAAISALGHLLSDVPVYRLAWNPESPPWELIRRLSRQGDGVVSSGAPPERSHA